MRFYLRPLQLVAPNSTEIGSDITFFYRCAKALNHVDYHWWFSLGERVSIGQSEIRILKILIPVVLKVIFHCNIGECYESHKTVFTSYDGLPGIRSTWFPYARRQRICLRRINLQLAGRC